MGEAPSLEEVRWRIDAIDAELIKLIDERASLAHAVAAAKRAAGDIGRFGLKPARETEILRRLLAQPRQGASPSLVVRIWRELIGESLAAQGPFHLSVYGGADPARAGELARLRFGAAPPLAHVAKPEEALAAAGKLGGVAVLAVPAEIPWWGRLLAKPELKVFAALPCLAAWGSLGALAVAAVEVEPTGTETTFWVTDARDSGEKIEEALGQDGVAGGLIAAAGGLKLFALAGFYQAGDPRLMRAPGRLSGVIGAAPNPLDV
jgi:chorismate mutase